MRLRASRGTVIGIAALLAVYFFLVPDFWPDPNVELRIPERASLDRDATVTLVVSSWHSNVQITSVHLVADCPNYQELGLTASVYPISLYRTDHVRQPWGRLSRFTWPRRRRYEYTLPLRDLAARGIATRGVLRGRAHVSFGFPDISPLHIIGEANRTETNQLSVPFSITLR
jgi:hypothetical protein